jgi:ribosome biogenesis GTPase
VSALLRLGWNIVCANQVIALSRPDLRWVRIVEEQRGAYRVAGEFDGMAEVSGRFRHQAASAADFPAVGDWVGVTEADGRAVIHHRLERHSVISRTAAGRAVEEHVLAANVTTILLVTAVGDDLSPRRLERYLTTVWDSGAVPVVVLNKADLSEDSDAVARDLTQRLPFVEVVLVSALADQGVSALTPYLRPGDTLALVGSSGVGKSTLVNRLSGAEPQRVAAISHHDGRGRHTTTARALIELPGGALLIDTPGLRELQPWADASAVDGTFDEVTRLGEQCRFRDCGHETEDGCAVQAAVATGGVAGRSIGALPSPVARGRVWGTQA